VILWWLAAALASPVAEAEAVWWSFLGDVVPGRPGAQEALLRWLERYNDGGLRAQAVVILLDAYQYRDHRTQMQAFELARSSIRELESRRGRRQVQKLSQHRPRELIDLEFLEVLYGQLAVAPAAAELHVTPELGVLPGYSALAHFGLQADLFDLEGLWLVGASVENAWKGGEPLGRGELVLGAGGDGVLLLAGAGLSTEIGLHQFVQLELTNDGDGPWPILALRLQTEEGLEAPGFGVRGLAQIGFKLGETPD
jgi:hypothetical protein